MSLTTSQTIIFVEVLRILRDHENRNARKKIYEAYMEHKLETKSSDQETRTCIERLSGDFDEVGFLVKEFNIENEIFSLYSDTIRRVWIALEKQIQIEENERKNKDPTSNQFVHYFKQLASEAKKYRDKQNLAEPGFTDLRKM